MIHADITKHVLDLESILGEIYNTEMGAMVTFMGIVRDHNHGRRVKYLDYEAHPVIAKKNILELLKESTSRWSLNCAIAVHRIGRLKVGEVAVIIVTGSAHRKDAYLSNQYIIDKLKQETPIWKKETFADGSHVWGNHCNCETHEHDSQELSRNSNQAFMPPSK